LAGIVAAVVGAAAAAMVALGAFDGDEAPQSAPAGAGLAVGVSPQTTLDARDYDKLENAGTEIVRLPLNWSHVQAEPGDCQWDTPNGVCNWVNLDAQIGNASESGARVIPILSDIPGWVYKHTTKPPLNGEARAGWEDFVDAAVRRYGPNGEFWKTGYADPPYTGAPENAKPIEEWQVWNEPNGKVYFHPKPNPRKYAYLLGITADAIRAVEPDAQILLAGMFGTAEIPQPKFLREMYDVGGVEDDFDAIALHPYSKGVHELKLQIRWARKELKKAGDENAGLWITELGWASGSGEHPLEKGREGQADLLTKSFRLLSKNRERWNVEGVVWFTWQDRMDDAVCQFCRTAGLFDARDRSKPAYAAFKQATGS
jgi:polysaccharide biosynthesis protein PslG